MMPRIIVYKPEKEDEYFIVKIVPKGKGKKVVIIINAEGERKEYEVKDVHFYTLKKETGGKIGFFANSINLKVDCVKIIGDSLLLYF